MSDQEAVKVIVRCRPLNEQERRDGRQVAVQVDSREGQVTLRHATDGDKTFTFDQAHGQDARQEDVYAGAAASLVGAVLEGFNATVLAYGQTGCGKTHTMEGWEVPAEERGIVPRAFDHIFREIERGRGDREFLVRVTHLEIYNEEVRDLLSRDPKARVEVRESPDRGVHVRGLKEFVVKSAAEMAGVLEAGRKNRTVGATLMNQDSSRSHSIFTVVVEAVDKGAAAPGPSGGSRPPSQPGSPAKGGGGGRGGQAGLRVGKLHLVDLAGSERQSKTGASGQRLKEATRINLSLSALGNVIASLTDPGATHVPYRDSKLTRLLQDSLGGNAKTVMIANIGPADYNCDETLSTLRYASRAKFIQNKPKVNEDPKDALLREFQAEISRLKEELASLQHEQEAGGGPSPGSGPSAADAAGRGGGGQAALDTRAAAIGHEARADLARQLQEAATVEALAKARQEIEAEARKRLEVEMAALAASQQERQHAEALLAAQQAELQAYAAEVEREQQERLLLEQRIRAMESQVLRGGQNVGGQVEALEAAAAARQEDLTRQRAAMAAQAARAAELEEALNELQGQCSGAREGAAGKGARLQGVAALVQAARAECAAQAAEFQAERERLLEDARRLRKQIAQQELVIAAYIPPEYVQLIHSHCRWDETAACWSLDHLEWAGNMVRARRECGASMSGSEASSRSESAASSAPATQRGGGDDDRDGGWGGLGGGDGGVLQGASDRLANIYFSVSPLHEAQGHGSPGRRLGAGLLGRSSSPPVGRPRTAAMAARQAMRRPTPHALHGTQWG